MKLRMKFNILAALICLLCLPIASCQEAGSDVYFKGISLYSAKGGVPAAASCPSGTFAGGDAEGFRFCLTT